jgi:hypothetical protein
MLGSVNWGRVASAATAALFALVSMAACGRTSMWPGERKSGGSASGGANGPGGAGGVGGQVAEGGSQQGGGGQGGTASQGPGGGGTGGTGQCVIDADCDDFELCTTDRCKDGKCTYAMKDADNDGAGDVVCGGNDCNDKNPNTKPGVLEICTDADDNDCNGVADCFDPACLKAPVCGCTPTGNEKCNNGSDDDCDTAVDCNDADCIGTAECGCAAKESKCDDGVDEDCDKKIDCQDADCASSKTCQCQAQTEDCENNVDDDCDLLVDCGDPNCFGIGVCACTPPGVPESCTDAFDNDCDGKVDCADADCAASAACKMCTPEVCNDNKDNDCDEKIDCADDACAFAMNCSPKQEKCNNSLDDDLDGLTDCDDPDCSNNPLCASQHSNCLTAQLISGTGKFTGNTKGFVGKTKGSCVGGGNAGEAVFYIVLSQPSRVHLDTKGTSFDSTLYVRHGSCGEGPELACDDDSGGDKWSAAIDFTILYPGTYYIFVDGFTVDPKLGANDGPYVLNVEIEANPKENTSQRCSDALDNDGDVYTDCGDPDCVNVGTCINCAAGGPPSAEFGVAKCTDGKDNDCDGKTDAQDTDCSASPYASPLEVCNGKDDNDNKVADDFSCRCNNTNECNGTPGQICYTHTIHACGLPCDKFFGTVCPSIASGSSCNKVTGQCEFQ